MNKLFKNFLAIIIAALIFIPFTVYAATEISVEDLEAAAALDGEYTDKGISLLTNTWEDEYGEYSHSCWSLKSGDYKLADSIPAEFNLEGIGFCLDDVKVTFDLNGKTVYSHINEEVYYDNSVIFARNSELTIKGNGTLRGYSLAVDGGNVVIENGTFDYVEAYGAWDSDAEDYADFVYLTVNGGTFNEQIYGDYAVITINDGSFGSYETEHNVIYVTNTSTLTINGGSFKTSGDSVLYGSSDGYYEYIADDEVSFIIEEGTESNIIINGGTFNSNNETAIVVEGVYGNNDSGVYYTINGGTFTGASAGLVLSADAKYLTIKGGTFKASEDFGGAIVVVSKDGSEFNSIVSEGYKYNPELIVSQVEEYGEDEAGNKVYASQKEISVVADYKVLDGNNQTFDVKGTKLLSFRFNIPFEDFQASGKVYVDDKLVDASNYTASEGSTIITFTKEFAKANIHDGDHTIKVTTDLGEVTANFKVINNPATGDNVAIFAALLTTALAGTYIVCNRSKKREN